MTRVFWADTQLGGGGGRVKEEGQSVYGAERETFLFWGALFSGDAQRARGPSREWFTFTHSSEPSEWMELRWASP